MTFLLQILAVIALIYNAVVTVVLIGWLVKSFIKDWRQTWREN